MPDQGRSARLSEEPQLFEVRRLSTDQNCRQFWLIHGRSPFDDRAAEDLLTPSLEFDKLLGMLVRQVGDNLGRL